MKRKIIIDCDPGHDDAVALVLATLAPELELMGVTVVAGNSSLKNTVRNALHVLAFAGANTIPVYAGCVKPLERQLLNQSGEEIHGEDGLGNYRFDVEAALPQRKHAVDYLIETLRAAEKPITLVCLGPLTNIAAVFERCPECKQNVDCLVIMGGAVRVPGNVTPAAEFNFYVDPEAAKIVLESGCNIYLHPLDATMQALFKRKDIEMLEYAEDKLANFVGSLLALYAGTYEKELGFYACPVHDALCIGALIQPSLVEYENAAIDVVTEGEMAGKCLIDTSRTGSVWFATKIDSRGFVRIVEETVSADK
ncbi:nucleoside hydrolase [Christensenella tenuis]|uniref:Nucleoside hydrolase n=1 Tax=Christensenella tenuis TaxID=2763033 RepID=A0ABR7EDU4_9FIRM|nr:nucleoside hydrolase [Christensenella tenuis]MBC5647955.1 nucleoside hydrolase [Christensenella tenuis]